MKLTILGVNYNATFANHTFYESNLQGYVNRSNEINIEKLDNLLKSIRNIASTATLGLKVIDPQIIDHTPFTKGKRVFLPPNINITFIEPNKGEQAYVLDRVSDEDDTFCKMTKKDKDFISEKVLTDLKSQNLNYVSIIQGLKMDMLFQVRQSLSNYLKKEEEKVNNYKKSMVEAVKLFKSSQALRFDRQWRLF